MHPFELIRELASIDKIRLTVAHREFVRAFKSLKSLSIYFDGNFMIEGRPFNADQLAANLMEELSSERFIASKPRMFSFQSSNPIVNHLKSFSFNLSIPVRQLICHRCVRQVIGMNSNLNNFFIDTSIEGTKDLRVDWAKLATRQVNRECPVGNQTV